MISAGSVIPALMEPKDQEKSKKGRCPARLKVVGQVFLPFNTF